MSALCTLQKWYPVTFGIADTAIFFTSDRRDEDEDEAEEDIDYDEYFNVRHSFFLTFLVHVIVRVAFELEFDFRPLSPCHSLRVC